MGLKRKQRRLLEKFNRKQMKKIEVARHNEAYEKKKAYESEEFKKMMSDMIAYSHELEKNR